MAELATYTACRLHTAQDSQTPVFRSIGKAIRLFIINASVCLTVLLQVHHHEY